MVHAVYAHLPHSHGDLCWALLSGGAAMASSDCLLTVVVRSVAFRLLSSSSFVHIASSYPRCAPAPAMTRIAQRGSTQALLAAAALSFLRLSILGHQVATAASVSCTGPNTRYYSLDISQGYAAPGGFLPT